MLNAGFNAIEDGCFQGSSRMKVDQKGPLPYNLPHILRNDGTEHSYALLNGERKKL